MVKIPPIMVKLEMVYNSVLPTCCFLASCSFRVTHRNTLGKDRSSPQILKLVGALEQLDDFSIKLGISIIQLTSPHVFKRG